MEWKLIGGVASMTGQEHLREVVSRLRTHADLFRARGVTNLAIFGSVARGEANESSDVDLVIDIDPAARFTFFDQVDLIDASSDLLARPVDVVTRRGLRPRMAATVAREAVDVF